MYRTVTAFVLALTISSGILAQSTIVPIVELRGGGLLGGVRDGKWIEPSIAFESLTEDSKVKLIGFKGAEKASPVGLKRGPVEDVCDDFFRMDLGLEPRSGVAIGKQKGRNPLRPDVLEQAPHLPWRALKAPQYHHEGPFAGFRPISARCSRCRHGVLSVACRRKLLRDGMPKRRGFPTR